MALEEAGTGELIDALVHERLDAAFVRSPLSGTPNLQAEPILTEPMLLALPMDHPLAQDAHTALPLSALAGEAFVLYRRRVGLGLYDAILVACREAGFSPRVIQEAPRMAATLSLVAAGLGLSIVPASMQRLRGDGIAYRPLAECPGLIAPLHLATRVGDSSSVLQRFRVVVITTITSSGSSPGDAWRLTNPTPTLKTEILIQGVNKYVRNAQHFRYRRWLERQGCRVRCVCP